MTNGSAAGTDTGGQNFLSLAAVRTPTAPFV